MKPTVVPKNVDFVTIHTFSRRIIFEYRPTNGNWHEIDAESFSVFFKNLFINYYYRPAIMIQPIAYKAGIGPTFTVRRT